MHLRAVALLPAAVAVVVPALIVWRTGAVSVGWGLPAGLDVLPVILGVALVAVGAGLFAWTVRLFARRGRGTLAPWDPTAALVVEGPYRHVRNPMITRSAASSPARPCCSARRPSRSGSARSRS